jgi:hypothetical protein
MTGHNLVDKQERLVYGLSAAFLFLMAAPFQATASPPSASTPPSPSTPPSAATTPPSKTHAAVAILVDAFVLKQDCKTVGPQLIAVSKSAIRCESLRSHNVLLCFAPDWQVLVYNAQTRRSKLTPLKQFKGYLQKQMVLFSNTSYFDKPVVPAGRKTFFGFPGYLYKEPAGYRESLLVPYRKGVYGGNEPAEISYKTLALDGIPGEEGTVMERYYSLPERPGLPVDFSFVSITDDRRSYLTTVQVAKQKVDAAIFQAPGDLTVCKTLEEVFLDAASEGSDELLNMFERKK